MKNIKLTAIHGAVAIAVLVISYFVWRLERSWNYSQGYEDKVHDTVRDMVKPECLKEP